MNMFGSSVSPLRGFAISVAFPPRRSTFYVFRSLRGGDHFSFLFLPVFVLGGMGFLFFVLGVYYYYCSPPGPLVGFSMAR